MAMAAISGRSKRRGRRAIHLIVAVTVVWTALAITPTHAQAPKVIDPLTWADAPRPPLHRSQADWLFDVGLKSSVEMFGPFPTRPYAVGDQERFIPLGRTNGTREAFFLAYRSAHAYFWFQRGTLPDMEVLARAAAYFEDHIWPLNTRIYGDAWTPGIDGDRRLHVVNQPAIGPEVFGAFAPVDLCPRSLCPLSNQREIIYISLETAPLGSTMYLTTLAHEHQHLIQYTADGNERRWFNEGLSQLAEHLNGFAPQTIAGPNVAAFLEKPDHALRGWQFGSEVGQYYGASYLFLVYLYERFGLDFIRQLVISEYDGLASVDAALRRTGQAQTVDDVFADWIVANYLDDAYVGDGRYYYRTLDLPDLSTGIAPPPLPFVAGSSTHRERVNQYGADYLLIDQPGTYDLSFDGADEVALIGTRPYSADWMWWSYDGESSASRLTGAFDLRGLTTATLAFSAWWHIEPVYDWFQVLVSDDGGESWQIVGGSAATGTCTCAPGAHYDGQSGKWIEERIDLSAYAGVEVLVRFEYLTDSSESLPGVALDDLGIVELGALDDVESGAGGWLAEGFLRVPNTVPQGWAVAVVVQRADGSAQVTPLTLDQFNTGRTRITVPPGGHATVIVGATAPFTMTRTTYKVSVRAVG